MKKLFFLFLFIPSIIFSQSDATKGIHFEQNLSWEQVKQKAKKENKYIFVDCYATWCGPCKAMDKYVYPEEKVGATVNQKFISVKIQMDKTDKDDERVKAWYAEAKSMDNKYKIDAYPTLLFFSADGSLVHRVTEGVNVEGFLDVVATALDVKKRYYSLLSEYQNGKKDIDIMPDLIMAAKAARDKKMAEQIAEDYFTLLKVESLQNKEIRDLVREFNKGKTSQKLAIGYINSLKQKEVFTEDHLNFINSFTQSTDDRGFKIFYNNKRKVNRVFSNLPLPSGAQRITSDYAGTIVKRIVYKEEFYNRIFKPAIDSPSKSINPDWFNIERIIKRKYPKVDADVIVTDAKVNWYLWKKDLIQYSTNLVKQMTLKYDIHNIQSNETFFINNDCWSLFLKSNDPNILNQAIHWMEEVFRQNPKDTTWATGLDTYANLLYKIGRIDDAIKWETKAITLEPNDEGIKDAFEKMKLGKPTWTQQ